MDKCTKVKLLCRQACWANYENGRDLICEGEILYFISSDEYGEVELRDNQDNILLLPKMQFENKTMFEECE